MGPPRKSRSVAALLAPTVGWEKSQEAVAATVRRLGLDEDELEPDQVTRVLEDLSLEEGIVGVTARVLLTKVSKNSTSRPDMAPPSATVPPPSVPSDDAPASVRLAATIGVHEVIGQLAPLLGADRAEAAIHATLRKLGLPRERIDHEQAVRLLDDLGHQDGLVGMTVRFARTRVLARFAT
jgi:hypothetical protein